LIWFFNDLARVAAEKTAVEELASEVDWLSDLDWSFDQAARLRLKFAIVIGEQRYPLTLTYPKFFPSTPPDISPTDANQRLSAHQYGNGSLCLEYRPDNWQTHFTGADMIRSAHRLLSAERPADGPPQRVASAHSITKGQELKFEYVRHLVPADLRAFVASIAEDVPLRVEIRLVFHTGDMSAIVSRVWRRDESVWAPRDVPKIGSAYRGILLRVSKTGLEKLVEDTTGAMARDFRDAYALTFPTPLNDYADREFIMVTDGTDIRLIWQLAKDKDEMTQFGNLDIDDEIPRLPPGYDVLAGKKVAIVGCGSVGSKVAVSLARSGVGDFVLLDDDVLVRKNLVRNDLDWRNIGEHKADGVAKRIRMVRPASAAKLQRFRLSGQEATASTATVLSQVTDCDLIVDATADARVFNLLSSVIMSAKKPMVWCEVFAGGIGGFVARHRPGIDHPPQTMRASLLSWFEDQNVPWTGGNRGDYGAEGEDNVPLVADDGDVAVIAAHTSRLAVDVLMDGNMFPHSMYVLGLKRGSVFEQPFEAHPIDVSAPRPTEALMDQADADVGEAIEFLSGLLGTKSDETHRT
jgi:hypothetical protein